jgi:hypothetical protein
MRKLPREFFLLCLALAGIVIAFPIQIMFAYQYTPMEFDSIIYGLAPLNWLVMATATMHLIAMYRASTFVYATLPFFLLAVAWNNWLVGSLETQYSAATATVGTFAAILMHGVLFMKNAKVVLQDQRKRWWLTPVRKKVTIRAVLMPVLGGELHSRTFDLSENGAFIPLDEASWAPLKSAPVTHLEEGNVCSVRLMLDSLTTIHCGAEIVRQTHATGHYPTGIGIRFISLNPNQKRVISSAMEQAA